MAIFNSYVKDQIWLWINTYENTVFNGMNIHFNPAILMWTIGVLLVLTHCQMGVPRMEVYDGKILNDF